VSEAADDDAGPGAGSEYGAGGTDGGDTLSPLRRVAIVLAVAAVLGAVAALTSDLPVQFFGGPHGGGMGPGNGMGHGGGGMDGAMGTPFEPLVLVKVFLATFNLVVLLALAWSYLALYRELPNRFTRSLLLVTGALFLYALASNPVTSLVFGYRGGLGLGPFTFLPDLFAAVAVTVLLYQSYQ